MLTQLKECDPSGPVLPLTTVLSGQPRPGARRSITVDKIASVACRADLAENLWVSLGTIVPKAGDLVAVKLLNDHASYNRLELTNGRLAKLNQGDLIVGALGARRALKGFVGDVPQELTIGDELNLLNLGGVLGRCTGFHHEMGPPIRAEYMGAVYRDGKTLNMADDALPSIEHLGHMRGIPVVAVAGSCMHSGKTRAATELVRRFTSRGYRVAGGKLSGVACLKDSLEMRDNGAVKTLCFVDLGLPSTVGVPDLGAVARTIIGHLGSSPVDVVVVELGDGILGGYHVGAILEDEAVRGNLASLVYCASDFVGTWGGIELLKQKSLAPDVISGSVTDSRMGVDYIRQSFGLPAANAIGQGSTLFSIVEAKTMAWRQKWQDA